MAPDEPVQLDLFSDASRHRQLAEDALNEFRLADAIREFSLCLETYPREDETKSRLATIAELEAALARHRARANDELRALLDLRDHVVKTELRTAWNRRVASVAEERAEGCVVEGVPAGLFWLDGGDPQRAESSLRATLRDATNKARILAYLGDAIFRGGEEGSALAHYLSAFLMGPADVDVERIASEDVRRFARAGAMPEDAAGDGWDWIAPVGVVQGFFELPKRNFWGVEKLPGDPDLHAAGRPGLEFFRLLLDDRDRPEAARRQAIWKRMKDLSPSLFADYREAIRAT